MKTLRTSLKRHFLTGLLVITPIWGTVLVLKTLFVTVDGILGNLLNSVGNTPSVHRFKRKRLQNQQIQRSL